MKLEDLKPDHIGHQRVACQIARRQKCRRSEWYTWEAFCDAQALQNSLLSSGVTPEEALEWLKKEGSVYAIHAEAPLHTEA